MRFGDGRFHAKPQLHLIPVAEQQYAADYFDDLRQLDADRLLVHRNELLGATNQARLIFLGDGDAISTRKNDALESAV